MKKVSAYQSSFESYLNNKDWGHGSATIYEPIQYILENGGKRFRPVLTLLAGDSLGKIEDLHYKFALGIEVFHNFTLLHDDIMDHADLRRGKASVHKRFGTNAAILSGDLMLILATQIIQSACQESTRDLNDVLKLFLEVGQEICEGQDMDMHFEESSSGNMDAYEEMVRQKTAVLLGFSLYAGARASDIPEELSKALYDYGVQSGIVFQMWDDYLDVFSAETTGKRNAGDLYNRKETCLVIKLKEVMVAEDFGQFEMIWKNSMSDRDVEKIKSLFGKYDIKKTIEQIVQDKLNQAKRKISSTFSDEQISPILNFTDQFILRNK